MKRACLSVVALVVVAACTEQPTATAARKPGGGNTSAARAAPQSEYVATPRGWYHRSCVHEIPNGAQVGVSGLVTRSDGSTYQIPPCTYPSHQSTPDARPASSSVYADGWVEFADYFKQDANPWRSLTGRWKVPAAPTGSYPSNTVRVYYAQQVLEANYAELMPALAYGWNGQWGGAYWTMTSWFFNSWTGNSLYTRMGTNPTSGDVLYDSVFATNCGTNWCTWKVVSRDSTAGVAATLTVTDSTTNTRLFLDAYGGVVDAVQLTSCDQFPASGVYFSNIALRDTAGPVYYANWSNYADPSTGCYLKAFSDNTYLWVHLIHTSLLTGTSITGPSRVKPNTNCTYWASVPTGGVLPYSYTWSPSGAQNSNYVTVSFSRLGTDTLRVWVQDSVYQVVTALKSINVASSNPSCPYVPIP